MNIPGIFNMKVELTAGQKAEPEFPHRYTIAGMTKWLHRNGFSYRKPVGVSHKCSAQVRGDLRKAETGSR